MGSKQKLVKELKKLDCVVNYERKKASRKLGKCRFLNESDVLEC